MKEMRCSVCDKITAYLARGSKIAEGTIMTCIHCQDYRPPPRKNPAPNNDVPDFLKSMFGMK